MRIFLTLFHRYLGLAIALFLIITGITGAIISWDHELDELLNPHLLEATSEGEPRSATELALALERQFPDVQVTYYEMAAEPGHAYYYWVEPRVNPHTGELYDPGFNQVYMDPVSGEVIGTREWGSVWPISRENAVSFLYKLHFSLHIPEFWGSDHWGIWLLGIVALAWTFDSFVGFYLTLPRRRRAARGESSNVFLQRWKPAWMVRWSAGSYKLNFDLHRAFGLWTWGLLFIIAFTGFSLNLYREVFFPLMSQVSEVTPGPFDIRTPADHDKPITPLYGFEKAISLGQGEARVRGWPEPVGSLWYSREYGIYRLEFFSPDEGHGAGGVGHKAVYLDAVTAEPLGDWIPWRGTAADIFVQAQFPMHSGRILGLPGRILISLMGFVVAMLSVTGIVIWWRKRFARQIMRQRDSLPKQQVSAVSEFVR